MMPPVVKLPRQRKRQPSGKGQQQMEHDTTQIIKNLTFRLKTVLNERYRTIVDNLRGPRCPSGLT